MQCNWEYIYSISDKNHVLVNNKCVECVMLSKLNCFVLTFQEDVEVKESTTSQEDEESEDEGLEEV